MTISPRPQYSCISDAEKKEVMTKSLTLENPEAQKFKKMIAFVVETVIFPCFDDTEEKKPWQASSP